MAVTWLRKYHSSLRLTHRVDIVNFAPAQAYKSQVVNSKSILGFLTSRQFWKNLLLIVVFFCACVWLTFAWLRSYTHHGEQLTLPDYVGQNIDEIASQVSDDGFRVTVLDSVYLVGKPGHMIIQQNPIAGSKVKENRNVYVTITKKTADLIALDRLPILYGKDFSRKQRELYQSFEINAEIAGKRFDPGEPNHILEVRYEGEVISNSAGRKKDVQISKGATLQMIVSEREGGELAIPDLVCRTFAEAKFIIESSRLTLGEVITDGQIGIVDSAYVTGQVPDPGEGIMYMGDEIRLSISRNKPANCDQQ